MKIRLGIDIACRSPHHAACADETGKMLWSGHRFRTTPTDLALSGNGSRLTPWR